MPAVASKPTTLQATPAIARSLAARQVAAGVEAARARIEQDAGCGQASALAAVEQHLFHGRLQLAGEKLEQITRKLDARAEAAVVRDGLAETSALNTARGEEQERNESGALVVSARDGLLWLSRKQKLVGRALLAAERYRHFTSIVANGEVRTSQHGRVGGGGSSGFTPSEAKVQAVKELTEARRDGLRQDETMIGLVDAVCGRGETLTELAKGDKHVVHRLEIELQVACRLLARHWGIG